MDLSLFNNHISVYRSAKDNHGWSMTVAEFMSMGKDKRWNADIIAYRTMKQTLAEERELLAVKQARYEALKQQVAEDANPLGGEGTPEEESRLAEFMQLEDETREIAARVGRCKQLTEDMKRRFPCGCLSGCFAPTRSKTNLLHHSGLICIDIDDHYELTVDGKKVQYEQSLAHVPSILQQLPWVAYAGHSVGGVGYFAIIPLGPVSNAVPQGKGTPEPYTHEWYFECLEQEFMNLGIVIDRACRDTTRLRFISYDAAPCVRNAQCQHYMGLSNFVSRNERRVQQAQMQQQIALAAFRHKDADMDYRMMCKCVERAKAARLNMLESYEDWFTAASALSAAFGESGRPLFHTLSSLSTKYNPADTDRKYDNLLHSNNGKITIGSLFQMFKSNGICYKD